MLCYVMSDIYSLYLFCFFFFKQKTAYDVRFSDWSSDVFSSDLQGSCVTASTRAFVFPGQGSLSLAMLAELSELHPLVREAFVEASDGAGVDLWALSQGGPEEQLNRTEYTQPALLAAGVAVWRAWRRQGGAMPAAMAGHKNGRE